MRVLITSDWQTKFANLTQCEQAKNKVLSFVYLYKLEAVVFAGDLKDAYNPIDTRVALFWKDFILQLHRACVSSVIVLGNHDRIGLYQDDHNWLPILEQAGAHLFDKPGFHAVGKKNNRIWVLPFMRDSKRWKSAAAYTSRMTHQEDILVFHQTLNGTMFNRSGTTAKDGEYSVSALHPERYRYCVGGDVHLSQRVAENVYYVGSPFPMDWGEANQTKYFALVTDDGLQFVPTGMPGWYDPWVKGFKAPKSWEGTRVRLRIPVQRGSDYSTIMNRAKKKAEQEYPGALLTLLASVEDSDQDTVALEKLSALSERAQIEGYVRTVWDPDLADVEQAISYINHQLAKTGLGRRTDQGICFTRAWAKNFLSFDEVELKLNGEGLTVVTGVNRDWDGRSNGAGKSNLLSIIPVALFGKTLKNQAYNEWARKGGEGTSLAAVEATTAQGTKIRVERTRNPGTLKIWVNDKEIPAGNKPNVIQDEIENIFGFTWDMFTSLMYVSRVEQSYFLWGTPKQRHEILERLQNLERFSLARKSVNDDIGRTRQTILGWNSEIESVREQLRFLNTQNNADKEVERLQARFQEVTKELFSISIPDLTEQLKKLNVGEDKTRKQYRYVAQLETEERELKNRIKELQELPQICPTCRQKISRDYSQIKNTIANLQEELKNKSNVVQFESARFNRYSEFLKQLSEAYTEAKTQQQRLTARKSELTKHRFELEKDVERWKTVSKDQQQILEVVRENLKALEMLVETSNNDLQFQLKVLEIFSRDGLPSHLSRLVIPQLNSASQSFSNQLTDGEIQVHFSINNSGDPEITIINTHGGKRLNDQSDGEGALASLITSFALREVGPKINLLALDEPGTGLDSANSRVLANSIRNMKGFGSVFLITHSDVIASELADSKILTVIKENGISRLEES